MNAKHWKSFVPISLLLLFLGAAIAPAIGQSPIENALQQIDSLTDADQFEAAEALLTELDERFPESPLWQRAKAWGDFYLTRQQYARSIEGYRPLLGYAAPQDSAEAQAFARGLNDLGIAYYENGQMDSAQEAHKASLEIYEQYHNPQGLAFNYSNLANIAKIERRLTDALAYYEQAREAALAAKDTRGVGFMHLNMAILYRDTGKLIPGMDEVQQAISLFEGLMDTAMVYSGRWILSGIYMSMVDYRSAEVTLWDVVRYYETQALPRNLGRATRLLGQIKLQLDEPDSALHYLHRSRKLLTDINNNLGLTATYLELGRLHMHMDNLDSALNYLQTSLDMSVDQYQGYEGGARSSLAQVYLKRSQYNQAIREATLSLELNQQEPPVGEKISLYNTLYKAYSALGQTERALGYLEAKVAQTNILTSQEQNLALARLEYRNELNRKEEARLAEKERQQLLYAQRQTRQQWIIGTALTGALVFLLVMVISIRSYRRKQAANLALTEQKAVIENQYEELRSVNDKLIESAKREKALLEETIALKDRELSSVALVNHEKNSALQALAEKLESLTPHLTDEGKQEARSLKKSINSHQSLNQTWDTFFQHFQDVHPTFFDSLKEQYPRLTNNDLKLAAYLKIGMNNKEIASMSNLAADSVKRSINRLKKKMELPPEDSLRDYMFKFTGN